MHTTLVVITAKLKYWYTDTPYQVLNSVHLWKRVMIPIPKLQDLCRTYWCHRLLDTCHMVHRSNRKDIHTTH